MISITQRKPSPAITKSTLYAVSKDKWNTMEDTAWRMHCKYCGMPKCTSQAETTSNSEKIKLVAYYLLSSYNCLKASLM